MSQAQMDNIRTPVLPLSVSPVLHMLSHLLTLAGVVAVVLALVFGRQYLEDAERFPIKSFRILGTLDYADRDRLREVSNRHTQKGFYALNIDALRADLEATPWVASARIMREWPNELIIDIDEYEPMARWNDNALVSKSLSVFEPPQLDPNSALYESWRPMFDDLPQLSGSLGRHSAVVDDYRRYTQALQPYGVGIVSLVEDERHSQTLHLTNGVTVNLGYGEHGLRLNRFLDVFDRLVRPLDGKIARFDMRYSNGFAVSGAAIAQTGVIR